MTKEERRRIAGVLKGARSLIVDVAEKDHSPFRRARARGEVISIDSAIKILTESVQRVTERERRAYRGNGTRRSQASYSQRTGD